MAIIGGGNTMQPTPGLSRPERQTLGVTKRLSLRRRLVAGDAAAAAIAWVAVALISERPRHALVADLALVTLAVVATLLALHWQHLYRARVSASRSDEIARIGRAACAVGAAGVAADQLLGFRVDGHAVAGGVVAAFVAITYQRGRFREWVRAQRTEGLFGRPVLVIGGTAEAAALIETLHDWPELGFVPVAYAGEREPMAEPAAVPWAGRIDDIIATVEGCGAVGVVIAASALPSSELNRIVRDLHRHRIHVHLSSGITGMHHRRLRVQPIGYEPLIYIEPASLSSLQSAAKRVLDVSLAVLALPVALPLMGVAALAIKLGDGGQVMFRQQRVGHEGHSFTMLKLRTMCVDAEERLIDLRDGNERKGPLFKLTDDPRVTRVGRLLRATSIDELPQLFNVLGGSMSLVGPRPALRCEVDQFAHAAARHAVRPGITGLWQVEARHKASFAVYERLDLYYVENWSVWLDIAILLRTARVVLRQARQASSAAQHPSMAHRGAPARTDIGVGLPGLDEHRTIAGVHVMARAEADHHRRTRTEMP